MDFEFQIEYGTEDLIVLNRVTTWLYRRWIALITRLICAVVGVIQLGASILLLAVDGVSFLAVFGLLIACLLFAVLFFYHRINAWYSKRLLLKNTGPIFVTVGPEGIRERSKKGEGFYPYSAIENLCRCRGRTILMLDKRHGMIFPDSAIISGNLEAFGGYLMEQCGKRIQEIR